MKRKMSVPRRIFLVFNALMLTFIAFLCIFPFINMLAISFSKANYVEAGLVSVWPKGFTTQAYDFVLSNKKFWLAFWVSVKRVVLGVSINMILMILTAYPLSKTKAEFGARNVLSWFFVFTMMFSGGLIPTYLVLMKLHLLNKMWVLVLPGALHVNNMILLMNFFRSAPHEIEEAAMIDGASVMQTMIRIVLPISKPGLATVCLFRIVSHWNSWFDGMIYMTNPDNYPLQSYLHGVINNFEKMIEESVRSHGELLAMLNARTGRAAQLFIAMIPIMIVYPLLSRYFTTGLVMGSVKG